MGDRPGRVLFVFLDGVGIGEDDPQLNPLALAELPTLSSLLGGRRLVRGEVEAAARGGAAVAMADATLGIGGLPQSGTGQTSLLTGINAAREYGRHFGPWVPTALRDLLGSRSVLARARAGGRRVAFANATPDFQLGRSLREWRRPAAPPLAAAAAGLEMRGVEALRAGRAVASSITTEKWREHLDASIPPVEPAAAGAVLARICGDAELTLFAHYDTDFAGHRGEMHDAVAALRKVDDFLAGALAALPPDALLVISSDHGNLEDRSAQHTLNPVPVIGAGPGAHEIARHVRSIMDVAPLLMDLMGIEIRED